MFYYFSKMIYLWKEIFFGKQLGSADEIETPAKTTHNLKHSVPLPTELSSETKTKSTSGLFGIIHF